MRTIRGRLLAMMIAILVLTVAVIAVVSTRLTQQEIRRMVVEQDLSPVRPSVLLLERTYGSTGNWNGAAAVLERIAEVTERNAVLTDERFRIIAVAPRPLAGDVAVDSEGKLTFRRRTPRGVLQLMIATPQAGLRDAKGRVVGHLYLMNRETLPSGERSGFRRWLIVTFVAAGALGILMTLAIARRISRPIEMLTDAARQMERGDLSVRVDAGGRDEIGDLAHAFNAMAASVERGEELRRRMVADVAHELRTPLTNLRCQVEAIEDGLVEPRAEAIASIREEAALLERLVCDLQDLALADAGKLRLEPQRARLRDVAMRAAAAVERVAKGVAVDVDVPAELEATADPIRLHQILTNLLTNAIMHTPDGGRVVISAAASPDDVMISVRDTGTGIAVKDLPNVFERFYRSDASRGRSTGGAGLGLAIVKELVVAHGGRVWIESQAGSGTAAFFTLPS